MVNKITPEYDFCEFFGKNPEEYFTAARIANAERVYARCIEETGKNALQNMMEMIEKMIFLIRGANVGETADEMIDTIYAQAFSIKCNAGMYGFPLATAFANQLFYYCKEISGKSMTLNTKTSIEAHLSALKIIFKNNIQNMSDPIAQELLVELERVGNIE